MYKDAEIRKIKNRERNRKWAKNNPIAKARATKKYNDRVRAALLELLGGKCVRCGFDDKRALQVDHVNGGGAKDVKKMKKMKNAEYLQRVLEGSDEYQLLCANCNWIKRVENKEVRKVKNK